MVEKTYSFYTSNDEYINHLDKYWDGSFSNYVHNCFKRDINNTKNNKRHNFFQDISRYIVMLGIGCLFLLFSFNMGWDELLGFLIILLLGIFFVISSLVNIYLEVFKKWKMSS